MVNGDEPDSPEPTFAQLVGKVQRLKHDTVELQRRAPAPRRRPSSDDAGGGTDSWSESDAADDVDEYHRNGVQLGILRKLRRGHYPVSDEVDLHGLTITQARAHLSQFLDHAPRHRMSCVRIIHGKGLSSPGGKAVLKPRVRHWLRGDSRVLAFAPAPHDAGGSGALHVLLRSRQE